MDERGICLTSCSMSPSVSSSLVDSVYWGFPAPDCRGKKNKSKLPLNSSISGTAEITSWKLAEGVN